MDVRVGGRERVKGGFDGGVTTTFDAIYHDVVPRRAACLHLRDAHRRAEDFRFAGDARDRACGRGTHKAQDCEQGAFLDGYDDAGKRKHGTGELLDKSARR